MDKVHVRKGDTVMVITGKDAASKKIGKVVQVSPSEGKVIVEGVNIITKHVKPKKQGQPGGLIKAEAPLYASKVMLYCTKCKSATRVKKVVNEDGSKIRVCRKCGADI